MKRDGYAIIRCWGGIDTGVVPMYLSTCQLSNGTTLKTFGWIMIDLTICIFAAVVNDF